VATKKQRRRRAKEQRHEYVWEDAEGNELEPEEVPGRKPAPTELSKPARSGRQMQPPSWNRTLKRGLIFAPIMFGTVLLLSPKMSMATKVTQTLIIVCIFIPFSYLLDTVLWRSHKRRLERQRGTSSRGAG
jgi:hypothetical protein